VNKVAKVIFASGPGRYLFHRVTEPLHIDAAPGKNFDELDNPVIG
jgi:hypothetical protein